MEKKEIICLLKDLNWVEIEDLLIVIDKLLFFFKLSREEW